MREEDNQHIMAEIDWIENRIEKMMKRQKKFDEGDDKYLKLQSRIQRYMAELERLEEDLY
tara:strand:+ start:155 stop:334 length:180 start_codon:yes stop_codon:yes gene_type:complete